MGKKDVTSEVTNEQRQNMNFLKKTILPILAATIWIGLSEFIRNELFFKTYWINHYIELGLTFPSEPKNNAIWGLWSLCLAISIFIISKKFTLLQTTFICWFVGFVFMWIVIGNLNVLPYKILPFAVPLSIIEIFIAVLMIKKSTKKS